MGKTFSDVRSTWQNIKPPHLRPLTENIFTDVCVIGGGISGLTTAYSLLRQGVRVTVIDRDELGMGETGLTSAHLSYALDEGLEELEKIHGFDHAHLAIESHRQAIDFIETTILHEGISCDFKRIDGYLFQGSQNKIEKLEREWQAWIRHGFHFVQWKDKPEQTLGFSGPSLIFPLVAQFHPLHYLFGLAQAVLDLGGAIYTNTQANEVTAEYVQTALGHRISCRSVVVATHGPINNKIALQTKLALYRTYMVAFEWPHKMNEYKLLWDLDDPYHYVRWIKGSPPLLLVGGEDHRAGQDSNPSRHFARLVAWARHNFMENLKVKNFWSGPIIEPADGLAYIGLNPGDKNIYVITGGAGHGLTHGTLGGLLIRDLILGRSNLFSAVYTPNRSPTRNIESSPFEEAVKKPIDIQ